MPTCQRQTCQDVPIDDPSPAGRPVRMSREEQREVRQESVQGLHQLMMGFDQVSGRRDTISNAAVPGVPRQVLSLEAQLAETAQPMNRIMMMPSQPLEFGVPGRNMGPALPKMGFVPPNAFGSSCLGLQAVDHTNGGKWIRPKMMISRGQ